MDKLAEINVKKYPTELMQKKLSSTLVRICIFFVYFQFLGVVPGLDLQPNAFVFMVLFLLFFFEGFSVNLSVLIILLASLLLISIRIIVFDKAWNLSYLSVYFSSILGYLFFWIIYPKSKIGLSTKVIIIVFFIYLVVGIVQFYQPGFMTWLVQRSTGDALTYSATGRGVRSLASEPAALGKVFSTLNVLFVLSLFIRGKVRRYELLLYSVVFFMATLLVSRSAYAIGIHLFLLLLLFFLFSKKSFFLIVLFSAVVIPFFLSWTPTTLDEVRSVHLFLSLWNNPEFLLNQGAMRRVMNIPISLNNLKYYGFLGSGNSAESFYTSLWTPFGSLNHQTASRNYGGFIEFLARFGVFSIPILILYCFVAFKILKIKVFFGGRFVRLGVYFLFSLVLLSLQDSSPALPMSIMLVVSIYKFRNSLGSVQVYSRAKSKDSK